MKIIPKILIGLLTLTIFSCEDVIEIDLNNVEQRVVIEANIQTNTGIGLVKITKTRNFYEDNQFEALGGAEVLLLPPNGASAIALTEETPGQYIAENIATTPGEDYQLQITTPQGTQYTAIANAPYAVSIDSLEAEEHPFRDPDVDEDPFMVICHFTDPEDKDNFYRLKATINGESFPYLYILRDDEIIVNDDISLPVFSERVYKGDTVNIELISMDASSFQYFEEISDVSQQNGGRPIIPFNPKGNFDNDALGYFGIFTSDYQTITIK